MTKGFSFSKPQQERESLKSWVCHFVRLGLEVRLLKGIDDERYYLWREGEEASLGRSSTVHGLSGAFQEVPHEDLLPPPPWQFETITAEEADSEI